MTETLASWHPFVVHFAVAFSLGSAACDILDFFLHRRRLEETGFALMMAALPFLILAVITGNLAEGLMYSAATALHIENHVAYANIGMWVFCGTAIWRLFLHLKKLYTGRVKILYVFVITAAAASLYLAAMHGGRIRHDGFPPRESGQQLVAPSADSTRL